MTDKEMLELAAKAAGVEYGWQHIFDDYEGSTSEKWDWNPLTCDGDAFRLAMKLNLNIKFDVVPDGATVQAYAEQHHELDDVEITEIYERDQYKATRRVITRADAEIGKNL